MSKNHNLKVHKGKYVKVYMMAFYGFCVYPLLGRLMSLQVSRSMVENMGLPTENTFKRGAKFGAKDGVNDRIKCRVEITQPQ